MHKQAEHGPIRFCSAHSACVSRGRPSCALVEAKPCFARDGPYQSRLDAVSFWGKATAHFFSVVNHVDQVLEDVRGEVTCCSGLPPAELLAPPAGQLSVRGSRCPRSQRG